MTAQKDKSSEGGQGRSGDVQARQTDDGSFELVVENSAGVSSSSAPDPSDSAGEVQSERRPDKSGSRGAKRLSAVVVVALIVVAILVYAFSGDQQDAPSGDDAQAEAGFRPYLGGPGEERSSAKVGATAQDDEEEELEEEEPRTATDLEAPGEEEAWEVEGDSDSEVIVIEEEHPPEEFEEVEEPDDIDEIDEVERAPKKPNIDPSKIPRFRERLELPIKTPNIKHLPSPKLNKIQPRLPQNHVEPTGGDEAYEDEQGEFEDEQEAFEDEGYEGDEGDPEYDEEDDSFEEYDEGY